MVNFPGWPDRVLPRTAAAEAIRQACARRADARVFVMISGSLARGSGILEALGSALGDRLAGHFSGIRQHTPVEDIVSAAAAARAVGTDILVSIGGGSIVDAAKIVQMCLLYGLETLDELMAWQLKGRAIARDVLHIAVPTTLSCAEYTPFAGARVAATGLKQPFGNRRMVPSTIVLDPWLSRDTPETLWLSSGIRALDHAIEAVCSPGHNEFADTLALAGLPRVLDALDRTKRDPDDIAARGDAQVAAWFCAGGLASGVPMGASHAIGHAIGSLFDIGHGLTSCVALPGVIRFNAPAVPDRARLIAAAMGDANGNPADMLRDRIAALGLPTTLADVGVGPDRYPAIVDGALHESWLKANPRPIDAAGVMEILVG